ncbi:MAG: family 78 glycoside hydrolase catalytic domain, partial [Opitutaceae bacterium]|nr:family 78 glycoside hydrolase catalytic domain [Verrucomicrobiales bacterium]
MNVNQTARIIGIVAVLAAQTLLAGVQPLNLRCGAWLNPLGIDDPNPRLSWQVESTNPGERTQSQTAYQIQVATSPTSLAGDLSDLWDSGKVVSEQPLNVPYAGNVLTSVQQVFWRVRAWDQNDLASPWSPVATWTMGLVNTNDWQGGWLVGSASSQNLSVTGCNWIWYPEGIPASSAPPATRYFRKTVSVRTDSALTNAIFLLAADNSYIAYVNGTQAGQGQDFTVATPWTVTGQLSPGTNTLAISAVNTGTAGNPAGLLGKLVLRYADGQTTTVPFDATWKTRSSSQSGWQNPGFNDSSWTNALVLGSYGMSPWNSQVTVQITQALPIFRREFAVRPGLQRALVFISGLGHYELSANGSKVGDALLAPGWTKYNKTCLYDTLELTTHLTNGNNAVGVMLGNGMYNVPANSRYTKFTGSFGPPKVIAQIHLFYADGTNEVISTDSQWRTTSGPITFSGVFGGEDHDARLDPAGWKQAGFNDSAWSPATVATGPGGVLRGQSHAAPPLKAIQTLPPVQTNIISSSTRVYDLGQNASLIPRLTAHGQTGAVVRITPAELLNANGTVNRFSAGGGASYWQYTLAGSGTENWFPRFFYHGSRYLQVELIAAPGSAQLPVVDALEGVVVHSASEAVGDFSCSNELFNRTRTLIRWAQRNNLVSVLTDCPHRERLGWLEQYHLHGPSLRYEFDLAQFYAKTMDDMADSQTVAGLIPDIAPEFTVFGGGFRDSPEWGSSFIIVPWQQYQFTGDDTLLRQYYTRMKQYLTYLQSRASGYILNHGLGDWYDLGP